MAVPSVRLGVDIGGTFTDVVLEKDGVPFSIKVLTTYSAPENAIINGMHQVCAKAGVTPAQIDQIIHGTTLATNALIERRGAKTALITTEGFRDVIEMRTESRFEQYDLNLNLPDPLLPRQMRFTLAGRVDANGKILVDMDRAEVEASARKYLDKVGIGDKCDVYPAMLSGGQQQRAAIARALCMEPKALLFDEPTSALDPELEQEVVKVIKDLAAEGRTMLVVTHDMRMARDISDHVVFLHQGLIEEQGAPEELFTNPKSERLQGFLSVTQTA